MSINCASSAVEPKITTATTVAATTTTATAKSQTTEGAYPNKAQSA